MHWLKLSVFSFFVLLNSSPEDSSDDYRIVCYYTNWAQYRYGKAKFVPENIDPSLCTHLVFAFASVMGVAGTKTAVLRTLQWNDDSSDHFTGMHNRFRKVIHHYPRVKTLLAVDGWNKFIRENSKMLSSFTVRINFAKQVVSYLRKHRFDGIDIHWKYPAKDHVRIDNFKFGQIVKIMKTTFIVEGVTHRRIRLLLVLSTNIDCKHLHIEECRNLDFLNILTYDFHGPWDKYTGHPSPLFEKYGSVNKSVDSLMQSWGSCPKEKLNLGLAFYGRSFTLTSREDGLNAPAIPGRRGPYTRTEGFLAHYEICKMKTKSTKQMYLEEEKVFYMVQGNQWVGYENEKSITTKVCYTTQFGFGGVMIWALDLDDFKGKFCGKGQWPLLKTVKTQIQNKNGCLPLTRPTIRLTTGIF